MRRTCELVVGVVLSLQLASAGLADETSDVAQLEELTAKIQQVLPGGWVVEFQVKDDFCRRSRPMLVVSSTEKLPLEYQSMIGRPAPGGDDHPYITQERATIEFTFVPYLTSEAYAAARQRNEQLAHKRRQFERDRLQKDQGHYKGGFTPSTFESDTGEKTPLMREYAFLWLYTEPQSLPTHRFGTLAVGTMDIGGLSSITLKIHNPEKDKEYHEIVGALEKIFVAYEQPAGNADQ